MKWLDRTLATPAENLACDEAMLDLCEEAGVEILRFWESREPFVVLGYGNRFMDEVNVAECQRLGVPTLRRCSGGGTVVQGSGCLNYNLTLRIPEEGPLATVQGTNQFVMGKNRAALERVLGRSVAVMGHTDLAFADPAHGWLKFSGNAQRRRRHALVFHGTILHDFNLGLIGALLKSPTAQPDYRANRSHAEFVRNIPAASADVKAALQSAWGATSYEGPWPATQIHLLAESRYATDAWNLRR